MYIILTIYIEVYHTSVFLALNPPSHHAACSRVLGCFFFFCLLTIDYIKMLLFAQIPFPCCQTCQSLRIQDFLRSLCFGTPTHLQSMGPPSFLKEMDSRNMSTISNSLYYIYSESLNSSSWKCLTKTE